MTLYCGNSTDYVCTVSIPHSTLFIVSIFDFSTFCFSHSTFLYVLIVPNFIWLSKINDTKYDRNSINDVCTKSIPHSMWVTNTLLII